MPYGSGLPPCARQRESFEFTDVRGARELEGIGDDGAVEQLFSGLDFGVDDEHDLSVSQFGETPEAASS